MFLPYNSPLEVIPRLLNEGLTPHQIVEKLQRTHWNDDKRSNSQNRACYVTTKDIM